MKAIKLDSQLENAVFHHFMDQNIQNKLVRRTKETFKCIYGNQNITFYCKRTLESLLYF